MRDHPRPLLLIDSDAELMLAATRASWAIGPRTLLPLEARVVRQYLSHSASVGRLPAVAILRLRSADPVAADLVDWIGGQPGPIGSMPVLLVTDGALASASGPIDVWLEHSLQRLLG